MASMYADRPHVVDFVEETYAAEPNPPERWAVYRDELYNAAQHGREKAFMRLLLYSRKDFDPVNSPMPPEFLHAAILGNSLAIIEKVWELGSRQLVGQCLCNDFGRREGGGKWVQWLLDHGADPLACLASMKTDFCEGIKKGDPSVVPLLVRLREMLQSQPDLLETLAKLDAFEPYYDNTPLMLAASSGYVEVASLLLDLGVDIEAATYSSFRKTALCFALNSDKKNTKKKMLRLLLSRGANPNPRFSVPTDSTFDLLRLAAQTGKPGFVSLLIKHGAQVNAGFPLNGSFGEAKFAKTNIKDHQWRILKILQQHGLDLTKEHKEEGTALDVFCKKFVPTAPKAMPIIRYLLKKGVRVSRRTILEASDRMTEKLLLLLVEALVDNHRRRSCSDEETQRDLSFVLIRAAYLGLLPAVKVLVEKYGVSVNCHNERRAVSGVQDGDTPLMAVLRSEYPSVEVFEYLLLTAKADRELMNAQGETVNAIAWGSFSMAPVEIIRLLHEDEDEGDPRERVRIYRQSGYENEEPEELFW